MAREGVCWAGEKMKHQSRTFRRNLLREDECVFFLEYLNILEISFEHV